MYLHLSDLSALVVSSEDSKSVFEANFKGNEKGHSFNRVVTTVDIVAHEQVISIGRLATNLEQLSEIMELSMDISANCDWCTNLLDVRFIN